MANNTKKIIEEIAWDQDDLWESWADDLVDMIEQKLIEIDMLLSRIKHAIEVKRWIRVETETEMKRASKEAMQAMDTMKNIAYIKI